MRSISDLMDDAIREKSERESAKREQNAWHVSSLMSCLSGVYHQRMGNKPEFNARQLRIFEVGHQTEELMIKYLGDKVVETQIDVKFPQFDLVGHADAVIDDGEYCRLVECKSQNSKSFWWMMKEGTDAKPEHVVQTALYYKYIEKHRPDLFKRLDPEKPACVVYFSKDDLCIKEVPLFRERLDEAAEVGRQRVLLLNAAWNTKVPPEPAPSIIEERGKHKLNWLARFCSVHHLCTNNPNWLVEAELEVTKLNADAKKSVQIEKPKRSKKKGTPNSDGEGTGKTTEEK